MILGYNTNGLVHHEPMAAIRALAEIGYRAVGITIDHDLLSPLNPYWERQLYELRDLLDRLELRCVIETGARYLLDPWHKHEPSLISPEPSGRSRRLEFYRHALRCAVALHADCLSIWSGKRHPGVPEEQARQWLVEGLSQLCHEACAMGVPIGLEPEPGMFIATTEDYDDLRRYALELPCVLTLDVGHVVCQDEGPVSAIIERHASQIGNIHLEDIRRGTHEHLMFGEGEIDLMEVFASLRRIGYKKGVYVELSRHSHLGLQAAKQAFDVLRSYQAREQC